MKGNSLHIHPCMQILRSVFTVRNGVASIAARGLRTVSWRHFTNYNNRSADSQLVSLSKFHTGNTTEMCTPQNVGDNTSPVRLYNKERETHLLALWQHNIMFFTKFTLKGLNLFIAKNVKYKIIKRLFENSFTVQYI